MRDSGSMTSSMDSALSLGITIKSNTLVTLIMERNQVAVDSNLKEVIMKEIS